MRNIRIFRIFLAILFFVAAVVYLFCGPHVNPMAEVSEKVQIIPSIAAVTIGATLVWLLITFLFGRVYCSTVCPIGTLQDMAIPLRRKFHRKKSFRWKPGVKIRYHVAGVYMICLLAGIAGVPFLIEPWNIMRNIASVARPEAVETTWMTLSIGVSAGVGAGIVSFLCLFIAGFLFGRDFCNIICPIGTGMGLLNQATLYHIEIDPDKCSGCLKCEEVCPSSCVKVVSRYIDNARCVRCFDCLAVCGDDAIHFQKNRNRRGTPLLRKKIESR